MKKSFYKSLFLLFILLFAFNFLGKKFSTENKYKSQSIYVYNLSEDKEELSVNADERRMPASLVKIMTTYLSVQSVENFSDLAPIDENTYYDLLSKNASMAGFSPGEKTTYRDLLYGTMLASGAEAANSLAVNISGSREDFIIAMNEEANKLGMDNTNYATVEGLDYDGQYTSARDVSKLLKIALGNEYFREIFTSSDYVSSKTNINKNGIYIKSTVFDKLKDYEQKGFSILGGKSGTTYGAGLCWVTLARKNNKEYIVVVMGAPLEKLSNTGDWQVKDTLKILEELDK